MVFLEIILVGIVLYFLNSNSRKNETNALSAQIQSLEKAVKDLSAHFAAAQQSGNGEMPVAGFPETADADAPADTARPAALGAVAEKAVALEEIPAGETREERALRETYAAVYGEAVPSVEAPAPVAAPEGHEESSFFPEESVYAAQLPGTPSEPATVRTPTLEECGVCTESAPTEPDKDDFLYTETFDGPMERGTFTGEERSHTEVEQPSRELSGPGYLETFVNFIRGGNFWVAGGVIMLLLGFAFLAQLGIFPIELRIVGAALAGMAMVAFGLYIRDKKRMYALIMQGGGIGVLYLAAFASAKLTDMLPTATALGVMTALIIPAVALAVLQNAQVLALFGFMGGFAAPILLSDGSGNYVALFSCYTLLNLGILAICRYRLWRWLNFAGALCTFVVMGYWGITSYDVSMFGTTEPFLIGFTLIYIVITLGSVRREEFSFSEPLDVILACSIPFLAAVFQWWIVMDIPHGLSVSAVAFGAFFLLLAVAVWKLWGDRMRRLAEFYLANGVVLANLAVPLELSGNVTSTIWAVEGAILFFFACRIRSARIKAVAILLQVVGMTAFFWDIAASVEHTLLSTSIISLAALASACFHKLDAADPSRETPEPINSWLGDIGLERFFAILGLLWWFGGLALETARFAEEPLVTFFLAVSVSSAVLYFAGKKTDLRELACASVLVALVTAAWCLLVFSGGDYIRRSGELPSSYHFSAWQAFRLEAGAVFRHNFLTGLSAVAWAAFAATQLGMLRLSLSRIKPSRHAWWAGIVALELLFMLTSSGRGAALDFGLSRAWGHLASIFPALVYTVALTWKIKRYAEGRAGAFGPDHARILGGTVPIILFSLLGAWLFLSLFSTGRPDPLPFFVPILNPLELKQLLCIATFAMWQRAISQVPGMRFALPLPDLLLLLDAVLFAWLHSMLFRAIYHFTGIPMNRAWEHESFQVCLTALWGVWGMGHLIIGNRTRTRLLWVLGASLMLADTAKLFLVDLADKGTLFRVMSFFVMGGIFLLIGWLAPLPPSSRRKERGGNHNDAPGTGREPEEETARGESAGTLNT